MTGDSITDAKVQPGQVGGMIVHMDFNRTGAVQFERITGEHVRERLAIILDNRVYSAPVIKDRISGGSAIIEGTFIPGRGQRPGPGAAGWFVARAGENSGKPHCGPVSR